MATPTPTLYTVGSGRTIAGGMRLATNEAAVFGNSIEAESFGLTSWYWMNGLTGGKFKLIANGGYPGDTIAQMLARVRNNYSRGASNSGLGNVGPLKLINFRGATNDAQAAHSLASIQSDWEALFSEMADLASLVVVSACPPHGTYSLTNSYNAFQEAYCAAHPSNFIWLDDCSGIREANGSQKSGMFSDALHPSYSGVYQMGHDGAAVQDWIDLCDLMADPKDEVSALEWFPNQSMSGTGGSKSGFTGTVVNSLSISNYGTFGGVCSVVAADGGDPDQTPWQEVAFTQTSGGGNAMRASGTLSLRTITDADPSRLDVITEFRGVDLDQSKFSRLRLSVASSFGSVSPTANFLFKSSGLWNETAVMRQALPRATTSGATSMNWFLELEGAASFSGDAGRIQWRTIRVRG